MLTIAEAQQPVQIIILHTPLQLSIIGYVFFKFWPALGRSGLLQVFLLFPERKFHVF